VRDTSSGSPAAGWPSRRGSDSHRLDDEAAGQDRRDSGRAWLVGYCRRHWQLIAAGCWTAGWFVILSPHGGIAWKFFTQGGTLLFESQSPARALPGGLHLYANYPQLQIGPLAFLITQALRVLGPNQGLFATEAILSALGVYLVHAIERIALTVRPGLARQPMMLRFTFLAGGAVFLVAWVELAAAFAHLDDALALALAVLAVRAAVTGHPVSAGLCIGLGTDAKPWAIAFLPVLLVLPVRAWWRAAAAAAAIVAAAWLPFAIADPHSTAALHYTIRNLPGSALRALGVTDRRTPSWDRTAQLLIGWGLALVALWRRRWPAVILLAVGARIALDPADHGYYTAGIMVGALLWDALGSRRPVPLWSVTSFVALNAIHAVIKNHVLLGQLRLALVLALTAAILLAPARWTWQGDPGT